MDDATTALEQLLSLEDLAHRWGVSLPAVRKWRARKRLPAAIMLGDLPRWRMKDIEKWERDRKESLPSVPSGGKIEADTLPRGSAP